MLERGRSGVGGVALPTRPVSATGRAACSRKASASPPATSSATAHSSPASTNVRRGRGRVNGCACSTDRLGSSCERLLLLPQARRVSWRLVFVTFEGADGSGKSTQAELLRDALAAEGREVVLTREPGGTELGERTRELVLNGPEMGAWAEAALYAASRAEHVEEVIRPALDRGADVIADRYVDSSLAYQGFARGLGIDAVLDLNLAVTGGLLPDVTFLLLLDPGVAAGRRFEPDRLEREGTELQAKVDAAYRELAARFPERIVTVNADRPASDIGHEIREQRRQRS